MYKDLLIHESAKNLGEITKFKFKFLFVMMLCSLVPTSLFGYKFIFEYESSIANAGILLIGAIIIMSAILLRAKGRYQLSAMLFVPALYVVTFIMIFFVGAFNAPGFFWLSITPLIYGFLLGRKWTLVGGVLSVFSYVILIYFNDFAQAYNVIDSDELYQLERVINIFLFSIFVTAISFFFSLLTDRALENLLKQKEGVENLLRVIVHDISNPLTILEGKLSVVSRKHNLEEKELKQLNASMNILHDIISSVRMLMLKNISLDSKDFEIIDVYEAVKNSSQFFRESAEEKGVQLITELKSESPKIKGNIGILQNQIINNLLTNAIKFSEEGSKVKIAVSALGANTVVEIIDSGVGMEEEKLKNLFEIKSGKSTKGVRGEKGTGFGLTIAKSFIDLFGGSINVTSSTEKGKSGTTFQLIFPTAK